MSIGETALTRRKLLKTTLQSGVAAGAALVIGFDLPRFAKGAPEKPVINPLRAWIKIDQSGSSDADVLEIRNGTGRCYFVAHDFGG